MSRIEAEKALSEAEALLTTRKLRAALLAFDAAERLGAEPDRCCAGRWMTWMLKGEFRAAWRESDAIRALGLPDEHRFWQGEPIAGKRVIVRSLHGYGDAVQMLRYAPALRALAASVVFEVAPDLLDLARCCAGVTEVITWGEDAPATPPAWDVQVEITELPYLFRTIAADLPVASGYVEVPASAVQAAAKAMGPRNGLRVGLCSAASDWDPKRSLPPAALEELLATPGVEWWSMDRTGGLSGDARLRSVRAVCGDGLLPLAAAVSQLDLVITVDTLAAHLAGAMGRPVLLMLQYAADWRWMTERKDSPWYPGMRLFRQPEVGAWAPVLQAVGRVLAERAGSAGTPA